MSEGCALVITTREAMTTTVRVKLFTSRTELYAWYGTHAKSGESSHVVSRNDELTLTLSTDDAKERMLAKLREEFPYGH